MHVLHSNLAAEVQNQEGGVKLRSIVKYLQSLSLANVSTVTQVLKLVLIMPATNSLSEDRSVHYDAPLKTWLRNTMRQTRLNWCMLLHVQNEDSETDALDFLKIANKFVARNSSRQNIFGNFT